MDTCAVGMTHSAAARVTAIDITYYMVLPLYYVALPLIPVDDGLAPARQWGA